MRFLKCTILMLNWDFKGQIAILENAYYGFENRIFKSHILKSQIQTNP